MKIAQNKVVGVSYELRVGDARGEVVETVDSSRPMEFIYGVGQLLPKFEEYLLGLQEGDNFEFTLLCDEAYGKAMEEYVVDVPKSVFEVNGKIDESILKEGQALPMQNAEGQRLNGVIVEVKQDVVVMDFNHPMADEDLHFRGKIESVRDATPEELSKGLHHGAGCSCGDCGGECSGCDGGDCDKGSCGR